MDWYPGPTYPISFSGLVTHTYGRSEDDPSGSRRKPEIVNWISLLWRFSPVSETITHIPTLLVPDTFV